MISAIGVAQTINFGPIVLFLTLAIEKKINIKGISIIPFLNNAKIRLLQGFPTAWKKEIIVYAIAEKGAPMHNILKNSTERIMELFSWTKMFDNGFAHINETTIANKAIAIEIAPLV